MAGLLGCVLAAFAETPARALKTEMFSVKATAGKSQSVTVTSGQALLRLSSGTAAASLDAPLAALGARRLSDLGGGWLLVGWSDGGRVTDKLTSLAALPDVKAAQESRVFRALKTPNDPLFNAQYALAQVNAPAGWEYEVGNSNRVTIAVVDSGIDGAQPDLVAKLANTTSRAYDPNTGALETTPPNNDPLTPACDHATRVAGVAAASTDDGLLVSGLSWGAQLVSYKVFLDADCTTDCGGNACATNDPALISAINQAISVQNTANYGHMVINMSLGGAGACNDAALQTAITNANAAGIVVVAAAGNDGGPVNSPGDCAGVIPMAATDSSNQIASFSSNGPELAAGGLAAPGVGVLTTDVGGGTASADGTSFSSPMGAGLAALILSAKPSLTSAQVSALMRAGAQDIGRPAAYQGAGLMNVYRTMRLATVGTLAGFDGEQKPISFPNPFRLSQTPNVSFSLPSSLQGSGLNIKIYTEDGVFVRELSSPLWDGRNKNGGAVASGSYVYVVTTDKGSARARMTVIR